MANFDATFGNDTQFNATFSSDNSMDAGFGSIQFIEIGHYESLPDKPKINSITVEGDKTGLEYMLQDKLEFASVHDIERILYLDI